MMAVTLELRPETEERLRFAAQQEGRSLEALLNDWIEEKARSAKSEAGEPPTAAQLLRMTREERAPYLRAAAELAAPYYNADLALPVEERELTAFTALDGEPFYEDDEPESKQG